MYEIVAEKSGGRKPHIFFETVTFENDVGYALVDGVFLLTSLRIYSFLSLTANVLLLTIVIISTIFIACPHSLVARSDNFLSPSFDKIL